MVGSDITEKKRAEVEVGSKTALLEVQMPATIDGILVVDEQASVLFHNQRFVEILDSPQALSSNRSDDLPLQHMLGRVEDPKRFLQRVT